MLVNVIKDGKAYQTVAFAILYNKNKTEVFIMNENDEFEMVYLYKQDTNNIVMQVLPVDIRKFENGWIKEKNQEGYKEFIHKPRTLDKIRRGEKDIFDYETMIYYSSLTGSTGHDVNYGPIGVDTKEAIDNLMSFTGGFHDASIDKIEWSNDKKDVTLTLAGVWGVKSLKLIFKDVLNMNLEEDYQWNFFFDASIFFPYDGEEQIVFSDGENITSLEECKGLTYVRARTMLYSFEYGLFKKER